MLKLTRGTGTQTVTVYPDVTSSYFGNPSSSIWIKPTHDYTSVDYSKVSGSIINNPTNYDPRLVISVDKTGIPSKTGQYTVSVEERIEVNPKWGDIEIKFSQADWRWDDDSPDTYPITLDTDRAQVEGTNTPTNKRYTRNNTPYKSY